MPRFLVQAHVVDGRIQFGALGGELRHRVAALLFAVDQSKFGHDILNS